MLIRPADAVQIGVAHSTITQISARTLNLKACFQSLAVPVPALGAVD